MKYTSNSKIKVAILSTLLIASINQAYAKVDCPTIDRQNLRDLCRSNAAVPLFGEAGQVHGEEGVILTNNLMNRDFCNEWKAIQQALGQIKDKLTKNKKVYQPITIKPEGGKCSYQINEKTVYDFSINAKTIEGVNILGGGHGTVGVMKGEQPAKPHQDPWRPFKKKAKTETPPVELPAVQEGEGRLGLKPVPSNEPPVPQQEGSPQPRKNPLPPHLRGNPSPSPLSSRPLPLPPRDLD
ncbi:MAG: hypothetical protein K2Y18_00100 [Alphaproteobacteria bacterium]|jgi:hypothetical protein|nr:hypothetical protein [Alphaproteobacteria bacterium]